MNKASACDAIPVEQFQILKDDPVKVLHSICQQIWKTQQWPHATGDEWRNNSRKNEETEPKQKQHPVVGMTGDGSKVRCCKEQYCIGTWNVRSMNQGKLEVVKQEMARVNIHILGIGKLKWTGMANLILMTTISTTEVKSA